MIIGLLFELDHPLKIQTKFDVTFFIYYKNMLRKTIYFTKHKMFSKLYSNIYLFFELMDEFFAIHNKNFLYL